MSSYEVDHLRQLAAQIGSKEITVSNACTQVLDSMGQPRSVARSTLIDAFRRYKIDLPAVSRRRPTTSISQVLLDAILDHFHRFPIGATRMVMSLQDSSSRALLGKVTYTMIQHAYDTLGLWQYRLDESDLENVRCRYEACQANLIWHTDLHQPHDGSDGYYIAFLDDASRRIMGLEYLERKTAASTALALVNTIRLNDVSPYALWSDNGTEFMAEFDQLLNASHIHHVHTQPYNPQQNGKMERFWPTLERRPTGMSLAEFVNEYNNLVHTSLPRNIAIEHVVVPQTPNQVHDSLPHWMTGGHSSWRIDGKVYPFDPRTAHNDAAEGERPIQRQVVKHRKRHRIPAHEG
jgi:transposase InsO family protein